MNKKFLSAILFGALMVTSTGTFVSCKDYDEDIENLQGQINNLATKSEVEAKLSQLQAAIDAARAESSATADKIAALDKCECDVDAMLAKVQESVDADMAKYKAEIEALIAEVEEMTGLTTDMITSIHFQEGYENAFDAFYNATNLKIYYNQMPDAWGDKKTYVFGKGLEGELTLNANQRISKSTTFLIQVSPANAVVTSDMLSLINSKNENLDEYVSLSVEKYTGLLTRAAAGTGLWAVTASLNNDADLDKFAKATWTATNAPYEIKFAVAATKDDRTVTSPYQLAVYAEERTDGICDLSKNSYIESSVKTKSLLWNYRQRYEGTSTNNEHCFPVAVAEDFTITVNPECGAVLASYVEVDYENSHLSTTDLAAVKALTVTGVDKVSSTGVFTLSIDGALAEGVVVPLKVHAIGYNGIATETVVWVKAGGSTAISQTAAYVVTPAAYVATPTAYAYSGKQPFTVPAGATRMETKIYAEDEIDINNNASLFASSVLKFFKADGKTAATEIKDIAVAQLNATLNLQTMKDDKVYEGTVKFFNSENTFLGQSAITIQKVLPTVLPEGFSVKTNQLNSANVYDCYLVPTSWTANSDKDAANNGTMDMDHVFNWGKGAAADYIISFAEAKWDAANEKNVANTLRGNADLSVAKGYINNETEHATKVVYNYGAISTALYDADKKVFNNYTVDAASFNTVFNCIYNDTYTWRWATHEDLGHKKVDGAWNGNLYPTELVYGGDVVGQDVTAYIQGVSSRDGLYSAKLKAPYNNSLAIKEAHLVSDANGEVDEYFKVLYTAGSTAITGFKATQTSTETNPTAAVASTLVITAYDMYGHTVTIKLPMTVVTR